MRKLLSLIGLMILISGLIWYKNLVSDIQDYPDSSLVSQFSSQGKDQARVIRVIDGDTIEVKIGSGQFKVRYIGMDTPETVDPHRPVGCYGHQASDENKKLVEGKTVWLEKDYSEVDKFGRLLRYVYLPINNQVLFINDFLVRTGFARVKAIAPDLEFIPRLEQAEQQARNQLLGLWQKC